jgi:hypothetical protein
MAKRRGGSKCAAHCMRFKRAAKACKGKGKRFHACMRSKLKK